MGTPQQPSKEGVPASTQGTTIAMAGTNNKISERSLSELLNVFRAPFSEDHSWAVCYQCARKLQKLNDECSITDIPTLSLTSVFITYTGGVELRKEKKLHGKTCMPHVAIPAPWRPHSSIIESLLNFIIAPQV